MLKMSTKGRYGLRALIELAILNEKYKKNIALKEIAKNQKISLKYLETLFIILKSAGIVKSQRGVFGGYFIANTPESISVLSVIEAIEGPVALVDCCIQGSACDNMSQCKTIPFWKKINQQLVDTLKTTSLRDLM